MRVRNTLAVPIIGLLGAAVLITAFTFYLLIVHSLHEALDQREAARAMGIKLAIDSIVDEEARELSALSRLLGGNPALASALARFSDSGDRSPLKGLLEALDGREEVFFAVADSGGRVVHSTGSPRGRGGEAGSWGVYEALRGEEVRSTSRDPGGWLIRAVSPIEADEEVIGAAIVGRMLDDGLARRLAGETDSQVAFCTAGEVVASSLAGGQRHDIDFDVARRALKDSGAPAFVEDEDNRRLLMYAPVRVVDETFAMVVQLDTAESHAVLAASKERLGRYFLGIFAAVMVLGLALTAHIVSPLKGLRERARKIVRDFSGQGEEAAVSGDEVESTVRAFDLMLDAVNRHISERREAEEARKLYLEAVEAAPDGIQIFDLDGVIVYSNRAMGQICGYVPQELTGKHLNYLGMDPEFAERVVLPGVREAGRWSGEFSARHRDGSAVAVWLSASLVRDEAGEPMAIVGVARDVTDRRLIELERERLIVELQQALAKIKTLRGLIPVCAWCGKARNDRGYWEKLENYIQEHSDASFTHGICPACMDKVEQEEERRRRSEDPPAGD